MFHIPTIKSINISSTKDKFVSVESTWTVADQNKAHSNDIISNFLIDKTTSEVYKFPITINKSPLKIDKQNSNILWSFHDSSSDRRYVCEEFNILEKNVKLGNVSPKDGTFVSIFNGIELEKTIKLLDPSDKELKKPFAKVLAFKNDPACPFTTLELSPDKTKIVFSVEAEIENNPKFQYTDSYGEVLFDYKNPTCAILNLITENVTVVKSEEAIFGQAVWSPDSRGLILVNHDKTPTRLGLVYCWQRPSSLQYYNLEDAKLTRLTEPSNSVRNPRFSPDGKTLVWLDMSVGGPHFKAQRLMAIKWNEFDRNTFKSSTDSIELVPIIDFPLEDGFPGIFNPMGLPFKCWSSDSRFVIFSTKWSFNHVPLLINVEGALSGSKSLLKLPRAIGPSMDWSNEKGSNQDISILGCFDNLIIAKISNLTTPPMIGLFKIPSEGLLTQEILDQLKWNLVKSSNEEGCEITGIECTNFKTTSSLSINLNELKVGEFESCLVKTSQATKYLSNKSKGKKGLIVVIHGGPHSCFLHSWSGTLASFLMEGYSLLTPNYRGSIGYGDAHVRCLPGHVGTSDVQDCVDSIEKCLADLVHDSTMPVYLFGGSHGGFLTCHLSARFGKLIKGAFALNPVTELLGMAYSSDIPDWAFVEANIVQYEKEQKDCLVENKVQPHGLDWYQGQVLTNGLALERMAKMSPLSYVDENWTVPIYIFLGDSDLRVPNWQGRVFYNKVKSCTSPGRVKTNIFMYPNQGHGINGVVESRDIFDNCVELIEFTQK